jgi:hypothetical protein
VFQLPEGYKFLSDVWVGPLILHLMNDESVCSGWSTDGEESVLRMSFGVDLVLSWDESASVVECASDCILD